MKRTFLVALAVSIAILLPTGAANATDYVPDTPSDPSLAGSLAIAECHRDAPWINYRITLNDPNNTATSHTARLVISDGKNSTEIPLGDLVNNQLAGRVLWPGASVDANGHPTGWPGWEFVNGAWVETGGNFGWARGNVTATIMVNPQLTLPLSYPQATPSCAAGPNGVTGSLTGTLSATGMSASVLPIGIAGGVVVAIGLVLLAVSRRAQRRS